MYQSGQAVLSNVPSLYYNVVHDQGSHHSGYLSQGLEEKSKKISRVIQIMLELGGELKDTTYVLAKWTEKSKAVSSTRSN